MVYIDLTKPSAQMYLPLMNSDFDTLRCLPCMETISIFAQPVREIGPINFFSADILYGDLDLNQVEKISATMWDRSK